MPSDAMERASKGPRGANPSTETAQRTSTKHKAHARQDAAPAECGRGRDALSPREASREDDAAKDELLKWKAALGMPSAMGEEEYVRLFSCVSRALCVRGGQHGSEEDVRSDWRSDSKGSAVIGEKFPLPLPAVPLASFRGSPRLFPQRAATAPTWQVWMDALVELAESWVKTPSPSESVRILQALRAAVMPRGKLVDDSSHVVEGAGLPAAARKQMQHRHDASARRLCEVGRTPITSSEMKEAEAKRCMLSLPASEVAWEDDDSSISPWSTGPPRRLQRACSRDSCEPRDLSSRRTARPSTSPMHSHRGSSPIAVSKPMEAQELVATDINPPLAAGGTDCECSCEALGFDSCDMLDLFHTQLHEEHILRAIEEPFWRAGVHTAKLSEADVHSSLLVRSLVTPAGERHSPRSRGRTPTDRQLLSSQAARAADLPADAFRSDSQPLLAQRKSFHAVGPPRKEPPAELAAPRGEDLWPPSAKPPTRSADATPSTAASRVCASATDAAAEGAATLAPPRGAAAASLAAGRAAALSSLPPSAPPPPAAAACHSCGSAPATRPSGGFLVHHDWAKAGGFRPSQAPSLAVSPLHRPKLSLEPSQHIQQEAERQRHTLRHSLSCGALRDAQPLRQPVLFPGLASRISTASVSPPTPVNASRISSADRQTKRGDVGVPWEQVSRGARLRAAQRARKREQMVSVAAGWAKGTAERAFSAQVADSFVEMLVP
ncbi:hypothetical protein AB1Y20_002120 [Prymnesium parvum]|uniref:Uncharacterized protein n=1 Tax=Prymnesium parvum TaxID=97485 RepID=A0AB34J7L2_PRYPA